MKKLTALGISRLALVLLAFAIHSQGNAQSGKNFECGEYPPTFDRDIAVGGGAAVSGWHKLASGEIRANVSVTAKKLLADHPDANLIHFMTSLLAYNCRAIQLETISPKEKSAARERFNELVVKALYKDGGLPKPATSASSSVQHKTKTVISTRELPSARIAAKHMLLASEQFKGALRETFMAALGGSYIPIVPYELMLDNFMLDSIVLQDMMQGIPNIKVFPPEANRSLANSACVSIRAAHKTTEKAFTIFNSRMPEIFYKDVDKIQDTKLYKYFAAAIEFDDCEVFQWQIKRGLNLKTELEDKNYTVTSSMPEFSKKDFSEYINTIRSMEEHARRIVESND